MHLRLATVVQLVWLLPGGCGQDVVSGKLFRCADDTECLAGYVCIDVHGSGQPTCQRMGTPGFNDAAGPDTLDDINVVADTGEDVDTLAIADTVEDTVSDAQAEIDDSTVNDTDIGVPHDVTTEVVQRETDTTEDPCTVTGPTIGLDKPELCDGLDNDCDGAIDEDFTDGTVILNAPLFEEDGGKRLGETCGVGACAGGIVGCNPQDLSQLTCISPQTAGPETCNGLDDNCDGAVDNGITLRDGLRVIGGQLPNGVYLRHDPCGRHGLRCLLRQRRWRRGLCTRRGVLDGL